MFACLHDTLSCRVKTTLRSFIIILVEVVIQLEIMSAVIIVKTVLALAVWPISENMEKVGEILTVICILCHWFLEEFLSLANKHAQTCSELYHALPQDPWAQHETEKRNTRFPAMPQQLQFVFPLLWQTPPNVLWWHIWRGAMMCAFGVSWKQTVS